MLGLKLKRVWSNEPSRTKSNRGGVSRIVAGPSAGTYLRLSGAFDAKGRQANIGIHQVGELEGIPVFKAPSSIIPTDEMLCV